MVCNMDPSLNRLRGACQRGRCVYVSGSSILEEHEIHRIVNRIVSVSKVGLERVWEALENSMGNELTGKMKNKVDSNEKKKVHRFQIVFGTGPEASCTSIHPRLRTAKHTRLGETVTQHRRLG